MAHCPVRCPAPPTSDWLIWCPMEQRTPRLVLLEEPYQGQRIHQSIHPADGGTGLDTASILVNKRETQSEKALNWGYFSIFKYHSSCHPPHSSFLNSLCLVISFNFLQYCVYYMYVCIYLFIHMFVFQRTVTWDLCVFAIVFVCTGILCVCVIQSVPPQTLSMSSPLISFKMRYCLCGSYGCIVNRGSHSCRVCKCLLLKVGFSKTE